MDEPGSWLCGDVRWDRTRADRRKVRRLRGNTIANCLAQVRQGHEIFLFMAGLPRVLIMWN